MELVSISVAAAQFAAPFATRWIQDFFLRRRIKEVYAQAAGATIDSCVDPDLKDEVSTLLLTEGRAAALASFLRREHSQLPEPLASLSGPVWTKMNDFISSVHDGLSRLLPLEMLIANQALEIILSQMSRKIDELLAKAQTAGPELILYETLRYKEGSEVTVEILTPYSRSIPLLGRDEQRASLDAWLNNPSKPVAVRVAVGSGGAGKTRLALDLCERAKADGWNAGFVIGDIARQLSGQTSSAWRPDKRTLLVIDYAASRAKKLFAWLTTLTSAGDAAGGEQAPLRVLLLERWADTNSGWWLEAFGRGSGEAALVQRLLDPPEPVPLPALDHRELRRAILGSIMKLVDADAGPPAEGEDEYFDKQLAALEWAGEPLFLMMAGYLAGEAGVKNALALSRTDLGYAVADHELARIDRIATTHGVAPKLLGHMAGYVTLCGGLSESDTHRAIEEECNTHGYDAARATVYQALCEALPTTAAGVGPILPDVVGEAVLLRAFGDLSAEASASTVARAAGIAGGRVSSTVIRTAQDYASDSLTPIAWLDRLVDESPTDLVWLNGIAGQLPEKTLALGEFAARLATTIVGLIRQEWDGKWTPDSRAALGAYLSDLADRLNAVGQFGEALKNAKEAADSYRELADSQPDAFRPVLAKCLNTLAISLSESDKHDEALAATEESVPIYRELASSQPDVHRPELGMALNTLANRLGQLDRHKESFEPAQEAAALYRDLAVSQPDAFRPLLATSLTNLARPLSELGRHRAAFDSAQEAVAISRELAVTQPDAFRPLLATSLHNLATCLSAVGQGEEALEPAREAADVFRELAATKPDAFRPQLELSLRNLAAQLRALGRIEDALAAAVEGMSIRRDLAD